MTSLIVFEHLIYSTGPLAGLGQEEKGTTEDEMVGEHHRLDGQESEQAPGEGEGQGSLVCCSPWGSKELGTTEQLNNKYPINIFNNYVLFIFFR